MKIRDISIKNLLRRKGRAAFLLAGLVAGVSTVVAIISFVGSVTRDINEKIEKFGANILILPKTESLSLTYGNLSMGGISFEMKEIKESRLKKINSIKNAGNIAAIGPMVFGTVHLKKRKVLMAGVNFTMSKILKPWWKIMGKLPGENGILPGSKVAEVLKLKPGDRVRVMNREFLVSGILTPTGSQDDQLLFVNLKTAQKAFNKEGIISMAEVAALCNACPIEDMVTQISEVLPNQKVIAIQQVVKGRMEALKQFEKFSYGISGVILLIGSLVVLVSMMGSVRERKNEIGIFRAVGFRKSHVMSIIMIEAGILSSIAGITGYGLGHFIAKISVSLFSGRANIPVPFQPELAVGAFLLAVSIGLSASIYPALMAARLDPNESLREL